MPGPYEIGRLSFSDAAKRRARPPMRLNGDSLTFCEAVKYKRELDVRGAEGSVFLTSDSNPNSTIEIQSLKETRGSGFGRKNTHQATYIAMPPPEGSVTSVFSSKALQNMLRSHRQIARY